MTALRSSTVSLLSSCLSNNSQFTSTSSSLVDCSSSFVVSSASVRFCISSFLLSSLSMACKFASLAGISSGGSTKSTTFASIALFTIWSHSANLGSSTIVIPPFSLIFRSPSVPSLSVPENSTPTAHFPWTLANELKKPSMGILCAPCWFGVSFKTLSVTSTSQFSGIT